jgi:hypothetical protein
MSKMLPVTHVLTVQQLTLAKSIAQWAQETSFVLPLQIALQRRVLRTAGNLMASVSAEKTNASSRMEITLSAVISMVPPHMAPPSIQMACAAALLTRMSVD